jgi:hypothetical protein
MPSVSDPGQEKFSIRLTASQEVGLASILEKQRAREKGAILMVIDRSYDAKEGVAILKADLAWLPWKLATKICRLIRASKNKETSAGRDRSHS